MPGKFVELMELVGLLESPELGDLGGDLKGELRVERAEGLGESVRAVEAVEEGVPAQGSS